MPIQHFFILMLENRSFDHVFGFSAINGKDATTGQPRTIDRPDPAVDKNTDESTGKLYPVKEGADFSLKGLDPDPGHEFGDVALQLKGPNLGFVDSYASCHAVDPGRVMECFSAAQMPVLNQLATEFAICDRWFSSLPGPTWPNRFFMTAASSGGLTKSPTTADIIKATGFEGYGFEHGNIFDALEKSSIPWSIVEGDMFPVSFALKGMNSHAENGRFTNIGDFAAKISAPGFIDRFIFIEPQYGSHKFDITGPGDFSGGNSMHPLDDVRKGEQLVKEVYETIRSVPVVWENSVLLIAFDEHGGFYDHVQPGATIPPGDDPVNVANGQQPFDFAQLGVRVPAVIISPLIAKGIIDHTVYDHSSALATLERLFNIAPLTKRDEAAADFLHLITLTQPRTDTPVSLGVPAMAMQTVLAVPQDTPETLKSELALLEPVPGLEKMSADPGVSGPQVGFAYVGMMRAIGKSKSVEETRAWQSEFSNIKTRRDAARFMARAKLKVHFDQYVAPGASLV
jgi:phospholipase C